MFLRHQEPLQRYHSLTPHFLPPPALLLPMSLPMCAPLRKGASIIADAKDGLVLSERCGVFGGRRWLHSYTCRPLI